MNELTEEQALVDFELKLKAALGRAQAAYEKRNEGDSYGEALDWGHEFGLNIATKLFQNYKEALGKVAPKEPTATIEMTVIVGTLIEEERLDFGRKFSEWHEECLQLKKEQALTDLLNALAAFELLLEEEQTQAKADLAEALAEDGYGSYAEGINWGYDYGARRIAREWQDCKEAIAKIGGKS